MRIWSVETDQGSFVLRGYEEQVYIEISQLDGDWIATGSNKKKTVQIWRLFQMP